LRVVYCDSTQSASRLFTTVLILDPNPPMRNVNMRNEVELRSILTTLFEDNLGVN